MNRVFTALCLMAASQVLAMTLSNYAQADDSCDETSVGQVDCLSRVANRAAAQLVKDWAYLTTLAKSRNPKALRYLSAGNLAFRNYLHKNCESEGHDAFAGTLQDVLEQKCRRDTLLSRHRLLERIGEAHPLGRTAEYIYGRPICDSFNDESKPLEVGGMVREKDVEALRAKLDDIGSKAAASGHFKPEVATLLRKAHVQAEAYRRQDSAYTCLGILDGFCSRVATPKSESEAVERMNWLSRCQTEILSSFYKRASTRLQNLKED